VSPPFRVLGRDSLFSLRIEATQSDPSEMKILLPVPDFFKGSPSLSYVAKEVTFGQREESGTTQEEPLPSPCSG